MLTIHSFYDALEHLQSADAHSLIIFDVDWVLTLPSEPALHPLHFQKYKEQIDLIYASMTRTQKHFFNHLISAHPVQLIESCAVDLIRSFQEQKIPTIAFTNAKKGRFSEEEKPFCEVRTQQLSSVGIDFSINAPHDNEYTTLKPTYGDYPGIKKGVLYGCGMDNKKGDVLEVFLKSHPSLRKIIFFDDKQKNLDSVDQMLRQAFPEHQFAGFLYRGAERTTPSRQLSSEEMIRYLRQLVESVFQMSWL